MSEPAEVVGKDGADDRPFKFKAVEVLSVQGGQAHFNDGGDSTPVVCLGFGNGLGATWDMAIALTDACDLFHRLGSVIYQMRRDGHLPAVV